MALKSIDSLPTRKNSAGMPHFLQSKQQTGKNLN